MAREREVRSVIEGLGDAFSQLDIDRWLGFFNPQHTFVHHDFVLVANSLDETKSAIAPMVKSLQDAGFRRSTLDLCNIKFLGSKIAVASTLWKRLGENDEVLEKFGSTYTLLDTAAGWKVVVVLGHDDDAVLVN